MPALGWSLFLFAWIQAQATLDQYGHAMLITYDIQQPSRAQAVSRVDIWFHVKGRSYQVATHRYSTPVTSFSDTFPWFSQSKWQGGDLELVFQGVDGTRISRYIPEDQIQRKSLEIPYDGGPMRVYEPTVQEGIGPDKYAWRHAGYDDESTFYYPFPLYPPLEFRWERRWGYAGSWASENSGTIANGVFYVAKEVAWNRIAAHDIYTGKLIWDRRATSNVWTASLAEGDTILFFGCSIGYTPWQDTTFYAMNLHTHEIIWALVGYGTVEYSPLTMDSLVYVPTLQDTTSAYTVSGQLLWKAPLTDNHPVYAMGRIVGYTPSNDPVFPWDTLNMVICRDAHGGDSLWAYSQRNWMGFPTLYGGQVYISFFMDKLFCFDLMTGDTVWGRTWTIPGLSVVPRSPFSHYNGLSFLSYGQWVGGGGTVTDTIYTHVEVYQSATGKILNHWIFAPSGQNGGVTSYTPITKNDYFWVNSYDYIYILFQDSLISITQLPPRYYAGYSGSWFFPIFWKTFLIHATDHWIFTYQGLDTAASPDTQPPNPIPSVWVPPLQRYPLTLSLSLDAYTSVGIDLYNVAGQLQTRIFHSSLPPGETLLEFPSLSFPSGTYILKVSLGTKNIFKKVVYFQTQGGVP